MGGLFGDRSCRRSNLLPWVNGRSSPRFLVPCAWPAHARAAESHARGYTGAQPASPRTAIKKADLERVEAVTRDDLARVVSSVISPDGKFLDARCWDPGALVVFARDSDTGKLTRVQTVAGRPDLVGATGVAVSPGGKLLAMATFQSRDAFLFERDTRSGKVRLLHTAPRSGKDWAFPVSVKFPPNGKFVCFVDDGGAAGGLGPNGAAGVTISGDGKFV
jgi:hypothetical protein